MTSGGDETKTRLLAHARDLYLSDGLARFSLREVARRAKVSAAAVYRHYDGKEALLRAVCAEGFRIFYSYLMRALAAPTPKTRMERCAAEYLRFGLENPRDYRFIFMSATEDLPVLSDGDLPQAAPAFQFLVDRVEECVRAKVLRKGDPQRQATVIWAHVHGLVSLRLSGQLADVGSDADFTALYDHATHELIEGMGR